MKKKFKAFSAPPFVLKAVMAGQVWEEGDESYHQELMVPALLIYGAQDKFVTLEEEQWMQEVIYSSSLEVIQDAGHMVMVESPVNHESSFSFLTSIFRVNWLIHNFLQRDPTTRSLHRESCDLSSKASIHVATNNDVTNTQNEAGPLQTVTECFSEEVRRRSSGPLLEPLDAESLKDVRRGSRSSLNVPGTITSTRRSSADGDDVEEVVIASPPRSSEIRLEIPQTDDTGNKAPLVDIADNRVEASASDVHCLDSLSDLDKRKSSENVSALVTGSLSPSLGAVHIMRPLAGVAWTNNTANARAKSRYSLRSFLRPKTQQSENVTGSQSAPPSPASSRSAKF
ncbi:uncharacterized protein LOC110053264 isoform X1 [Orbicella faveolata]|nr:uncharacterized protein LOC110053264 isoform X1 [Orbicella faveolata]